MVIQFFEIAENNIKEFKSQLKIAYKNHFKNTKSFKEAFKDFSVLKFQFQMIYILKILKKLRSNCMKTKKVVKKFI